jgi:spermidine synthase
MGGVVGYLIAVGYISILGQAVLLRELSVAFYGVELIYTLALGIWLVSGACGAMISRRTGQPSPTQINLLFILLSVGTLLSVIFIRSLRHLFSDVPGAYLPLHSQIAAMTISLLPAGVILGLLFQWTAKAYIGSDKSLAAAYSIESIGGLTGGLCATLFLRVGMQNFAIALLCAVAAAGSTFLGTRSHESRRFRALAMLIAAVLTVLLWKASPLDRFLTSWAHPGLVATLDTPYSRITVTQRADQTSVFENDALFFDTESTHAEEFVHLAALQHPAPEKVLILGGGIDGSVRETLLHSPRSVDYVEVNRALLDVVPNFLPADIRKSLHAANVRLIHDDPRRFLSRSSAYDLILIGMPEPTSGQTNRFFTREFFALCRAKLGNHGMLAFTLQSSENLWTPQLTRRMVSIYRAAKSVFPEVIFIPGIVNVVIASADRLTVDPTALAERLNARGIRPRIVSPNYIRFLYTNDRFQEVSRILESGTAPANTDIRPICYQYTIILWLSRFLPSSKDWNFPLPRMGTGAKLFWIITAVFPAVLVVRSGWRVRRAIVTLFAGFAGMSLETILILQYQTKSGILFQDIGILLTGFMAGLALGSFAVNEMRQQLSRQFGYAVLVGFAALSGLIGFAIQSGSDMGLWGTVGTLFMTGLFVAGIFAFATLRTADSQKEIVAPLYSADLFGGCLGAVVTSLVLAPMAGLSVTAYGMILMALYSALLL